MKIVNEGKAKIKVFPAEKISKSMDVFYNPVMKLNRDVSILLLNSLGKKDMQIALPLAGSGVRGVRFFLELQNEIIKGLAINDMSIDAVNLTKENIQRNKIDEDKIQITNKDANQFLLESSGFDYIDIDPFGTPNPFLDSALKRISRGGILAVTATDTSALAGSHPKACQRKYWAKPMKNEFMHETGIRILIRKVQLIGAQYSKAMIPIFSYTHEHYYRIFFRCDKGKQKADVMLKNHKYLLYNPKTIEREVSDTNNKWEFAGPMWVGNLWDTKLVEKMYENCSDYSFELISLVKIIKEESKIDSVGFYDLHKLAKIHKKSIPKISEVLSNGSTRTHFLGWGIRSKYSDPNKIINK